jgi:hypothetical protein
MVSRNCVPDATLAGRIWETRNSQSSTVAAWLAQTSQRDLHLTPARGRSDLRGGVDEILEQRDGLEQGRGDELEVAVAQAVEKVEGEHVRIERRNRALARHVGETGGQSEDGEVGYVLQEGVHRSWAPQGTGCEG